ncbi:hypothetical protein GCM10010233_52770 [Streptomyces pseudogriseolus]|uniref:Uncharacterized protein n=1 Tax=Streptomyces pseudogriseolus TaxID=36817 RepID=A0ABQ2T845_STREZ|nr:hypothetical protein GCM10010233_52770 [Streptomyces gancidicus]GGS57291.1 hypothetical protein GCM10010285_40890 [Streptomyces rubiginosus]
MPGDAPASAAVPPRTVPEGPDPANGPALNGIPRTAPRTAPRAARRTARRGTRRGTPGTGPRGGHPHGAPIHISGTRNLRSDSSYAAGSAFHIAACGAPLTV